MVRTTASALASIRGKLAALRAKQLSAGTLSGQVVVASSKKETLPLSPRLSRSIGSSQWRLQGKNIVFTRVVIDGKQHADWIASPAEHAAESKKLEDAVTRIVTADAAARKERADRIAKKAAERRERKLAQRKEAQIARNKERQEKQQKKIQARQERAAAAKRDRELGLSTGQIRAINASEGYVIVSNLNSSRAAYRVAFNNARYVFPGRPGALIREFTIGERLKFYTKAKGSQRISSSTHPAEYKAATTHLRLGVVDWIAGDRSTFHVKDWTDRGVGFTVKAGEATGIMPVVGNFVELEVEKALTNDAQPKLLRSHVRPFDILRSDVSGRVLWFDGRRGVIQFQGLGDAYFFAHSFSRASDAALLAADAGVLAAVKATVIRIPEFDAVTAEEPRAMLIASSVTVQSQAPEGEVVERGVEAIVTKYSESEVFVKLGGQLGDNVLLPLCLVPEIQRPFVTVKSKLIVDVMLVNEVLRVANVTLAVRTAEAVMASLPPDATVVPATTVSLQPELATIAVRTDAGNVLQILKTSIAGVELLVPGWPIHCYGVQTKNEEAFDWVGAIAFQPVAKGITGVVIGRSKNDLFERCVRVAYTPIGSSTESFTIVDIPLRAFTKTLDRKLLYRRAHVTFDLARFSSQQPNLVPASASLTALAKRKLLHKDLVGKLSDVSAKKIGVIVTRTHGVQVRLHKLRRAVRWHMRRGKPVKFDEAAGYGPMPAEAINVRCIESTKAPTLPDPVAH